MAIYINGINLVQTVLLLFVIIVIFIVLLKVLLYCGTESIIINNNCIINSITNGITLVQKVGILGLQNPHPNGILQLF